MYRRTFLIFAVVFLSHLSGHAESIAPPQHPYHISGPIAHANLVIYFVHGTSSDGRVPLTLEEALKANVVRVYETRSVNQLAIENFGDQEVFVQSGDILKGGQQDRVVTVSLVLPPRSGRLSIAAFCVEEGRWSQRGGEDAKQFASAAFGVPSRGAKLAIRSSGLAARSVSARGQPPGANSDLGAAADIAGRQRQVWNEVARIQRMLSDDLGASVASPRSETSLQLALENDKLPKAQKSYIDALQPGGEKRPDIIGYVVALNGKLNSAEIYPSNALFRKMWTKLLRANATEAIAAKQDYSETIPSIEAVEGFLKDTEAGNATKQVLTNSVELEMRDADRGVYFETRRSVGTWVNRSYLAK